MYPDAEENERDEARKISSMYCVSQLQNHKMEAF